MNNRSLPLPCLLRSLHLPLNSSAQRMVPPKFSLLFWILLSSLVILLINYPVKCDDDEEDNLFLGINKYRASLNLKALSRNKNADCLAEKIADQFKKQPCTNSTGANTVPGTEPQFSNYPDLLTKCHLAISNTRDGSVMPACVPKLVPNLVLANFTKSLYSDNLNDTTYTGIGIGSEDNWIVVVLTTNTPAGNFAPYTSNGANLISRSGLIFCSVLFLVGNIFLL
ncbi:hypothetical protein RJT34_25237 [Clitoria ternatea]|uniref:Uncharacterized GPI-anchored protein At5g19230-like domain-containing protein n=1 Tax=Clitoria ternatea TaxID=43366 RepID=A0AAN9FPN6_CLITE